MVDAQENIVENVRSAGRLRTIGAVLMTIGLLEQVAAAYHAIVNKDPSLLPSVGTMGLGITAAGAAFHHAGKQEQEYAIQQIQQSSSPNN